MSAPARPVLAVIRELVRKSLFPPGKRSASNRVRNCRHCSNGVPDQEFTRPLESLESGFEVSSSVHRAALLPVHIFLFAATLLTTTVFGYSLVHSFSLHLALD